MTFFQKAIPADNESLRQSLYCGAIYHLDKNEATTRLARHAMALVEAHLGQDGPVREAQFRLDRQAFYTKVGAIRKAIYTGPDFLDLVAEVMRSFAFSPDLHVFDPARLRVILHAGHEQPQAAPVYYPHRDTWYANPASQLTWWIPLHDVVEAETFAFFPDYFEQPVANNSEIFDYQAWTSDGWSRKIGWQNAKKDDPASYPILGQTIRLRNSLRVNAKAGELILFAGAHLHGTCRQMTGKTRFSLDFRTVNREDFLAGRGAPNVDNRSKGTTFHDHVTYAQRHDWGRQSAGEV